MLLYSVDTNLRCCTASHHHLVPFPTKTLREIIVVVLVFLKIIEHWLGFIKTYTNPDLN